MIICFGIIEVLVNQNKNTSNLVITNHPNGLENYKTIKCETRRLIHKKN